MQNDCTYTKQQHRDAKQLNKIYKTHVTQLQIDRNTTGIKQLWRQRHTCYIYMHKYMKQLQRYSQRQNYCENMQNNYTDTLRCMSALKTLSSNAKLWCSLKLWVTDCRLTVSSLSCSRFDSGWVWGCWGSGQTPETSRGSQSCFTGKKESLCLPGGQSWAELQTAGRWAPQSPAEHRKRPAQSVVRNTRTHSLRDTYPPVFSKDMKILMLTCFMWFRCLTVDRALY